MTDLVARTLALATVAQTREVRRARDRHQIAFTFPPKETAVTDYYGNPRIECMTDDNGEAYFLLSRSLLMRTANLGQWNGNEGWVHDDKCHQTRVSGEYPHFTDHEEWSIECYRLGVILIKEEGTK